MRGVSRHYFLPRPLLWMNDEVCHGSFSRKLWDLLSDKCEEGDGMCLSMHVWLRTPTVSVCLCVWLYAYVRTHACICTCHKQTSICASNTAGLWWHVPVQPPIAWRSLTLSLTQSHTYAHMYSPYKRSSKTFFNQIPFPLAFSCCSLCLSPPTSQFPFSFPAPPAMFPRSHLSSWVTACKNKKCGTTTITWGASLDHGPSVKTCLPVALFTIHSHTITTDNSPKSYVQQYMQRFGKGPFVRASQHMPFATCALSSRRPPVERGIGVSGQRVQR